MKKHLLLIASIFVVFTNSFAQRYRAEVFSNVNVTQNIIYGNNVSFLTGAPVSTDLKMDVYSPVGDTSVTRPVVVMLHTGSFLPAIINQTPTGSMRDSALVEMCMRFARRGYVAISADYRTGWNPQAVGPTGQDIRTGSLLLAVYRAVQDIKSCVRYLKMDYEMMGNTYGIDTTRIVLGGMGSGGYVALACATIRDTADFNLPKFISSTTNASYGFTAGQSYVNTGIWGDINGAGGTPGYNNPNNNQAYSSHVNFVFNCGGALGDSTWLRQGDVPMVCFHPPSDPFAPYGDGTVIVPTTGDPVVDVSGSHTIVMKADALGNNDCFVNQHFTDAFSTYANTVNDGYDGLMPFIYGAALAGPWEWFDSTTTVNYAIAYGLGSTAGTTIYQNALLTNQRMSKTIGLQYIDTIQGYLSPRLFTCLQLDQIDGIASNIIDKNINVYPNPASFEFSFDINDNTLNVESISIADVAGKVVYNNTRKFAQTEKIDIRNLNAGIYLLTIHTNKGISNRRLVVQ